MRASGRAPVRSSPRRSSALRVRFGRAARQRAQQIAEKPSIIFGDPTRKHAGTSLAPTRSPQPPCRRGRHQVVLDWLVFRDPAVAALVRAIGAGCAGWQRADARGTGARAAPHGRSSAPGRRRPQARSTVFDRHARLAGRSAADPVRHACAAATPTTRTSSTSPLTGARWLVSRDRAAAEAGAAVPSAGLSIVAARALGPPPHEKGRPKPPWRHAGPSDAAPTAAAVAAARRPHRSPRPPAPAARRPVPRPPARDRAALGLVHLFLDLARLVEGHAGAGGDQAADDDVFLQAAQLVALAHDGRLGQHARRLLEGGRGDERVGRQAGLGDAQQHVGVRRGQLALGAQPRRWCRAAPNARPARRRCSCCRPGSTICTRRSIWRTITSMCLSLIFTPCRR